MSDHDEIEDTVSEDGLAEKDGDLEDTETEDAVVPAIEPEEEEF